MRYLVAVSGHKPLRWRFALPLLLLPCADASTACSNCVSLVNARIYGDDFVMNLLLAAMPVLVMVAVAAAVHHGLRWPARRATAEFATKDRA
jgi:hypothetical protein